MNDVPVEMDDLDVIVMTGTQLPGDMMDEDLPSEIIGNPVFDGEKIVDLDEVQS